MTYSKSMKWPEVRAAVLQQMRGQPRGYQAELAKKIGKTPGFVNHIVVGKRPIPDEHLDVILDSLGMTYDVELTINHQPLAGASEAE